MKNPKNKDNKDAYYRLSTLNKIINGKPINLIQSREKSKVLVKTAEKNLGVSNERQTVA